MFVPLSVLFLIFANSNFLLVKYLKTQPGLMAKLNKLSNVNLGGVVKPVL